ncbi:isoaspartyl peptidase/L-asparaginase [soil metagenome]
MQKFSIAIHGGAGTILRQSMKPEIEASYNKGLEDALHAGYSVLEKGGTAVEAVKRAVMCLEDNILFNAGKGSVFTKKGMHEMDAAIMDGKTLNAGAVAGISKVKNPVELAEKIMLHSGHIFLTGKGAEEFGKENGIEFKPEKYFFSQFRYDQWTEIKDTDDFELDHGKEPVSDILVDKKFGTVGAVACDRLGNIAASTSTGGMTNKQFGRVGDSPLIGVGTYANNKTCAVSCTGHGEIFMQAVAAYDVSCLMEYKNLSLEEACKIVVLDKLVDMKGEGGLIAMDANGNASLVFNSAGMYRGVKSSDGTHAVSIYKYKE